MKKAFAFKYAIIPAELFCNPKIDKIGCIIFSMVNLLDSDNNHCWASNKFFAEALKISERTVSAIISSLIQEQYINKVNFDGRRRIIKINENYKEIHKEKANQMYQVTKELNEQDDENDDNLPGTNGSGQTGPDRPYRLVEPVHHTLSSKSITSSEELQVKLTTKVVNTNQNQNSQQPNTCLGLSPEEVPIGSAGEPLALPVVPLVNDSNLDIANAQPIKDPDPTAPSERLRRSIENRPKYKITREALPLDPFAGYDPEVKELFEYWNSKGKPLTKHLANGTKTCSKIKEALQWTLSKYTADQIKKSIDMYYFVQTLPLTSVNKHSIGFLVGLLDFLKPDQFLKGNIKNTRLKELKSWFIECLKDKDEILLRWSKMETDEYPKEKIRIKEYWNQYGGRRLDGIEDENLFRKIAKVAHKYFDEVTDKYVCRNDSMTHYIFDYLRSQNTDFRTYDPKWLASEKFYTERLSTYWTKIKLFERRAESFDDVNQRLRWEKEDKEKRTTIGSVIGRAATMAKIEAQKAAALASGIVDNYDYANEIY